MPVIPASSTGILLALLTAVCWAISPLCFASAGRRIGSIPVLLLRTLLASLLLILLLPCYGLVTGIHATLPAAGQIGWLVFSGLTGMAIGDALIYESLVLIGPRRSTQILTLAPVAAVLLGWLALGEKLSPQGIAGIALVLGATSYAVLAGRPPPDQQSPEPGGVSASGIIFAAAGAVCVGVGAITARQAYRSGPPLDGYMATLVRVCSSCLMLWVLPLGRQRLGATLKHLRDRVVMKRLGAGVLAGPFAGMLCYLFALKRLEAGVVSTLVATSPLFILPMINLRYRMRIGPNIAAAAALAVIGVAMITLH